MKCAKRQFIRVSAIVFVLYAFTPLAFSASAQVGFFAPPGLPKAVIEHTDIGLFNAESATQVARNLKRMDGTKFKAFVDLSPIVTRPQVPNKLSMRYVTPSGKIASKHFSPEQPSIIRFIPSDADLMRILGPIMTVLVRHKANVGAVFIADEPYMHGLSKATMERAAKVVRSALDRHGLQHVKIGVTFAAGMFNRSFAHLINKGAGAYVQSIDHYYATHGNGESVKAFDSWVNAIKHYRLVTYDRAGNMYIDGGLPNGFNIYGFDFYLSTVLLDSLDEDSLSWFAQHYPRAGCSRFAGQPMSHIRGQLSFFRDGGVLTDKRYQIADRRILDAMYTCRMNAVTDMLIHASKGKHAQFLLISESSDNGVLEFTPAGAPKPIQPRALIDARVLSEVNRAQRFYVHHACFYSAGLLYFTYQDAYDATIKLQIGGARGMPAVMAAIYGFAQHDKSMRAPTAANHRLGSCWGKQDRRSAERFRPSRKPVANVASLSIVSPSSLGCDSHHDAVAKVLWRVHTNKPQHVAIDVLAPDGTQPILFSSGGVSGAATTGDWVEPGTRFDLIDTGNGNDLATYTVTSSPCSSH